MMRLEMRSGSASVPRLMTPRLIGGFCILAPQPHRLMGQSVVTSNEEVGVRHWSTLPEVFLPSRTFLRSQSFLTTGIR